MSDLRQTSIEIILHHQSSSGAYPASPNFPTYRYCWFRDGAFISHAMDLVGEHASAQRFHNWAALNIIKRADVVERAVSKGRSGAPLEAADILHTRYSLNGDEVDEDWPNFQLDGFGTWLWALNEHCQHSKTEARQEWLDASRLVADYISALWHRPCFDCWEEFPEELHPYTLGAIYAGLKAHTSLNNIDHSKTTQDINAYLEKHAVSNGHIVKYVGSNDVDASLLGLAIPYRLKSPDDPLIRATVLKIETDLRHKGGVHRYSKDTYYGGGEWILLTAWLGWYYAQIGEWRQALSALKWIEAQADEQGYLPEQVPASLIDRAFYKTWQERWGEIANPLLWSHAKYIILTEALANQPAKN
jgi:GH15 family glucan-1,4-alpha-glucosidase